MGFSGEDFVPKAAKVLDAFSTEATKSKGGRPTVGNNMLLGSRNRWLSFFEECWPEVGWPLLRIRKCRLSTIADVQKIFEPIKRKQRCELADVFLRGLPAVSVSPQELIRKRIESSKLRFALQDMQRKLLELENSLRQGVNALRLSTGKDRVMIAAEVRRRAHLLWKSKQIEVPLRQRECEKREAQDRAGETYIYCSQLRDFLRSRRRAVTPIKLANALAGLPDMRWRESDARCSKMLEERYPLQPYAIFLTIEHLCKQVPVTRGQSRVDFFRAALAKLPQGHNRDFLCRQWRDFRLAIEEVYKGKHGNGLIPYALAAIFLRNANRPKTSLDNVLDTTEAFVPQNVAKRRKIGVLDKRAGRASRKARKKK